MKVSAFTRYRTINNEPVATLFIGDPKGSEGYSVQQVVDQFPSVPERKLKALQNLQGLSKYWGDAVAIDHKDYVVFFPEVNEEQPSLMMMRTLVKEGLVSGEVKFPTQLTVTEKGYSLLRGQAAPEARSPEPNASVIEEPPTPVAQPSKLAELHPKVLAKAERLFQDGHYRSAVLDTYVALNKDVQRKSKLNQDGSALMQKSFSKDTPVLKVAGGDDPQLGAMWLFSGAMMGVRNVLAHDDSIHPSEQEALELLYFASNLYRGLDLAVNVNAERLINEISQLTFILNGNESTSNSAKLKAFLVTSSEFIDSDLHRLCFLRILEIIKSSYFNDQNAGIDLLLEWDETLLDHLIHDDHVELICSIYKAAGGSYPSRSAGTLISNKFNKVSKSLKVFQEYMLSSDDAFYEVLEKIWFSDDFIKSIVKYGEEEFLITFLRKVIDKEFHLKRHDLNTLSYELNRAGIQNIFELADKVEKMNEES
ncbi:TIGR02391 family protein [Paenibacillus sp. ISL-20]|uniref:TIGR02391 family protein n=1 Tax=Paenibacillus sp. ISL-20 TaxID=2819163 RepID=UPI001BE73ABC|nr:TIGR02391 family protein [Paenibacillus sp. ISL-20]